MPNGLGRTPEARQRRIKLILRKARKREAMVKGEEFKRGLIRKRRQKEFLRAKKRQQQKEALQRKLKAEKERLALARQKQEIKKIKAERLKLKFAAVAKVSKEVTKGLKQRKRRRPKKEQTLKEVLFG